MAKGKGDATLGKLSKSLGLINSELQTIQRGIQLMREAGKSAKQIYTQYGKQLEKLIQDEADLNKQIEERKELVKNESDTLAKYNTLQRKSTKERKDALKQLSDIELKEYKKSENVKNSGLKADKRRKLAALKANDKLELQKIRSSKLSTNKRLEAELSVLNRIQRRYKKSSKEYKEAEIAKVKAQENALNARDKNIKKYRDSRPDTKEKTSFLGGVRQGLEGGAIGKAVGRLGGVGATIAVLRKSFQALSRAVTGSFKAAVDFEAQLAQLQAVTGINNQELSRLEKNVLDVAGSTKFTSEEIVQLQTELGKLGFSVSEIESATVAVARTAQALGEQVGPVAQRIGQILNQFNLDAAETTRVADSLVSVINSSALSFEGFSTALQYIGPLGAEVGTTFEETSVAMALLADNGFTASRIGTGLRGILTELSTTGKDLNTVVEDLADKEITLAEAVDLVGKRNAAQLITLVEAAKAQKELGGTLDDLSNKYFSQGSAAIAAAQQVDTFQGNLDLLKSAVNRVQISFGNLLKTSKFLRIALKFIDEEGYNASLAAEAIANSDPSKFSKGLSEAAEVVGNLKKELTDVAEVRSFERIAAQRLAKESIIEPMEKEIELAKKLQAQRQKDEKAQLAELDIKLKSNLADDERNKLQFERNQLQARINEDFKYNREEYQNIANLKEELDKRKEEGFDAEIEYIQTLISEAGVQNALARVRNEIEEEYQDLVKSFQNQRDKEIDTLKEANDFNDRVNNQNIEVQGKINELLAEQTKRKDDGNEITGEELILFNAKLEQYKQERTSLANLVVQKGELEKLAQKEFELEFKQLANRINARKQELEDEQALLDIQIKTQQNLAKNGATQEVQNKASEELVRLQIQRSKNEQEAFEDLNKTTEEYESLIKSIGREITRAELDGRFLEKAEERLKSFTLSFADLGISYTDIAKSTQELATLLANSLGEELKKGTPLSEIIVDEMFPDFTADKQVDTALKNLIKGLFPAVEENSEEFNKLFSILQPLLLSNLIPDPDAVKKKAEEDLKKLKKVIGKIFDELAEAAKEYNATSLDNTTSRLDAELEAVKNRYKVEGDIIKSQLDNQLITESQFRAKQKELRQKQLAEENDFNQKKFEAEKKADLINVGIETLEALASNILNNFKSFDSISATGLTAVGNAVILGGGALKADAIRRRKFFPVKYEEGGMVSGPSHAQGGVPFTVQGQAGYEMEGGEFIVNKKASAMHRGLLEKINNSYKVPTSPSAYKFAAGGAVNANANESVDYLKAIAEATTSTAISTSKPVRAFVSSKDLRANENERRLRDRNDKI
jgi:myosin heavy subunit